MNTSPLAKLTDAIGSLGSLMAWLSAIALVIAFLYRREKGAF